MSVIPENILATWKSRISVANNSLLVNLLDFREFEEELKRDKRLMQAYKEAAAANRMSEGTFRDRYALIRRFNNGDLPYWFGSGIGFDHLDKAVQLSEKPAQLLNDAIQIGGAYGTTMTVEEMVAHALLQSDKPRAVLSIRAENIAQQAVRKFRTLMRWDDERTEAFRRRIMEVVQEFMA